MSNILRQKIGEIEKQRKNKTFQCLYPGCQANSIGSHSQQRGGQLSVICENDYVYALNASFYDVVNKRELACRLIETKIRNASIYPGFCQKHDSAVFHSIEKMPLDKGNNLQAAILFFRTITYEITRKKLAKFTEEKILSECQELVSLDVWMMTALSLVGRNKFIEIDMPFLLENSYKAYQEPESGIIETHWVFIPKIIKASTCTVFSPIRNFKERIDNQTNGVQALSTFNLIPTKVGTHVVVSWFKIHDAYNNWIKDALVSDIEHFINYITICESEDICIGPELWRDVDIFTRDQVFHAMKHEVYRGPLHGVPRVIRI